MKRHDAPIRAARCTTRHNRPVVSKTDVKRRKHETRRDEAALRDAIAFAHHVERMLSRYGNYGFDLP